MRRRRETSGGGEAKDTEGYRYVVLTVLPLAPLLSSSFSHANPILTFSSYSTEAMRRGRRRSAGGRRRRRTQRTAGMFAVDHAAVACIALKYPRFSLRLPRASEMAEGLVVTVSRLLMSYVNIIHSLF